MGEVTARFHPLDRGYQITSGYGWRAFDNAVHKGIDFGWPGGSGGRPVFAIQAGTVQYAGAAAGYGGPDPAGWLVIDSDDAQGGGCFEYGHIVREVKVGDRVAAGQRIGRINPNQNSNGAVAPHLHVSWWPRAYGGPEGKQDFKRLLDGATYPGVTATVIGGGSGGSNTPKETSMPKPAFTELNRLGNSRSNRFGARITNFLLHTQEGDGSAEGLAAFCNNSANSASYHYTIRDGIVCDVVDTDYASWSVLDANSRTINLCFAGSFAGWSRAQWLAREGDIRVAAWLAVQDARKYGFAVTVLAPPYRVADGLSDHKYVTQALRIGSHTDVGSNFPWDRFSAFVREFTSPAPVVPVVNMIDAYAADTAHAWIGTRVDKQEIPCPDGRGRFVGFSNAHVYWTPTTGAHAVPAQLMGDYGVYKYESGPLGYPVADHTNLPDGQVQAFEKGVMYRHRDGKVAFYVTGRIGARWARDGYEKGPLGWPISNEQRRPDGSVRQDFQHGAIYWSPDGTVAVQQDFGDTTIHPQNH
ncbi:peptidoglycan DD-metalloendopeptidase family protein [Tsukamurella hominis]|uniref:peptidoglycan DD-metalloendopeptidase family protein n=1 Tax=Tsukamurella hominis TaxID=1970232 RepID=UPI0039EC402B